MPSEKKPNSAKGKDSYDAEVGGSLISFFNRNITPYPTEVGGPSFDLIPVEKQKDIMVNVARMYGQQEYNRIMELVAVLQKQAISIKHRLDVTDMVHSATYQFQTYHNQIYWLAYDSRLESNILCHTGPDDWSTGVPDNYRYICRVKWLGDYTWIEVDDQGNPTE
jgi:hypothetical protein